MNQDWLFGVRGPLPVTGSAPRKTNPPSAGEPGAFQAELDKQLKPSHIVVSNHAKQRLEKRNIRLNDVDLQRIGLAINQVAAKGGKESLILFKNTAFVVNVPNRTIITAFDQQSMKDNVFTNIDSAMIL
ncbi:TIGR02530 family flagellar biosynthesis protein [Effusibacillus consociatus]|uniref:TIGR02530 family flagellar biosynthesis protein n=1 Tax=Effusibacillus consociatus TaxID=1117041 RepID=A0ABV9Q3N5_9BACL